MTLLAVPDDGSEFAGWQGRGCTGSGECTLTVAGPTELTATLEQVDRSPPRIRTVAVSAARGRIAKLRFRVFDDSGRSRETRTILRGSVPIGRVVVPAADVVYRQIYTAHWRARTAIPLATSSTSRTCTCRTRNRRPTRRAS